jgi:hypothetical protein
LTPQCSTTRKTHACAGVSAQIAGITSLITLRERVAADDDWIVLIIGRIVLVGWVILIAGIRLIIGRIVEVVGWIVEIIRGVIRVVGIVCGIVRIVHRPAKPIHTNEPRIAGIVWITWQVQGAGRRGSRLLGWRISTRKTQKRTRQDNQLEHIHRTLLTARKPAAPKQNTNEKATALA